MARYLQKASNAVKNDEEIVQNLGQAIIMGKVDIDTNFFFTPPGILLQISSILIILLILNSLYISYKLKQSLVILAILQGKIGESHGLDQIVLDYFKTARARVNTSARGPLMSAIHYEYILHIISCIAI